MDGRRGRWVVLAVITVVGVLADWATKLLVLGTLEEGVLHPFLGSVVQWTLVFNPGSLAGMDPSRWIDGFPTRAFLMVVTVVELAVLLWVYAKLDASRHRPALWGLALVVPGAIGNFIDRVLGRPGVVDFVRVDLGFSPFHPWPTFNVADAFLTAGIILVLLDSLRKEGAKDPAPKDAPVRKRKAR